MAHPTQHRGWIDGANLRMAIASMAVAILIITASHIAVAQTFTALHDFNGMPDGATPIGGLTMDRAGNFYGTTQYGGADGYGMVFKLVHTGSTWIMHWLPAGKCWESYTADAPTQIAATDVVSVAPQLGDQSVGQILVSYSHKDQKWLERLETVLKPLIHGGASRASPRCIAPATGQAILGCSDGLGISPIFGVLDRSKVESSWCSGSYPSATQGTKRRESWLIRRMSHERKAKPEF